MSALISSVLGELPGGNRFCEVVHGEEDTEREREKSSGQDDSNNAQRKKRYAHNVPLIPSCFAEVS